MITSILAVLMLVVSANDQRRPAPAGGPEESDTIPSDGKRPEPWPSGFPCTEGRPGSPRPKTAERPWTIFCDSLRFDDSWK